MRQFIPRIRMGPVSAKVVLIIVVIWVLNWGLAMVRDLVYERQSRSQAVTQEIGELWGHAQTLAGPVLVIPYGVPGDRPGAEHTVRKGKAYFLPEDLTLTAKLNPETRRRGIFETVVYTVDAQFEGRFGPASLRGLAPRSEELILLWDEAVMAVGISDMRSIQEVIRLEVEAHKVAFTPGTQASKVLGNGMSANLANLAPRLSDGQGLPFKIKLRLNGSHRLHFLPLGRETKATVSSSWPTPGFGGAYLPTSHEISNDGFSARWTLAYFGRDYQQAFTSANAPKNIKQRLLSSAFGVDLKQPVTPYRKVERAIKYGLLFVAFTFGFYFIVEVTSRRRIHPIQYASVGLPLCLFYLLLVALAEHIGFLTAYLLGAGAIVSLVGWYSASVLGNRRRALAVTAVLGGLYGYLYTLLEQESYSLVWGSVGLLALTATFMYVTRDINWYRIDEGPPPSEPDVHPNLTSKGAQR